LLLVSCGAGSAAAPEWIRGKERQRNAGEHD
jgi:hypothetical protein